MILNRLSFPCKTWPSIWTKSPSYKTLAFSVSIVSEVISYHKLILYRVSWFSWTKTWLSSREPVTRFSIFYLMLEGCKASWSRQSHSFSARGTTMISTLILSQSSLKHPQCLWLPQLLRRSKNFASKAFCQKDLSAAGGRGSKWSWRRLSKS